MKNSGAFFGRRPPIRLVLSPKILLVACLGLAVPACALFQNDPPVFLVEGDVPILWQEIGEGEAGAFTGAFQVVETDEEWRRLWLRVHPGAGAAVPTVRFDREVVLAAMTLTRAAGPYQVRLKKVTREKTALLAVMDEGQFVYRESGDEAVTGSAYHVVRIPRPPAGVRTRYIYDNTAPIFR